MTWYGRAFFFAVHCVLHIFAYLLPRAVRLLWGLLCRCLCCTCLETDEYRRRHDYIYRPEREIKVIHHYDHLEVLENVFGLFDVRQSRREDRQYCVEEYYYEEFENRRAMRRGREGTPFVKRRTGGGFSDHARAPSTMTTATVVGGGDGDGGSHLRCDSAEAERVAARTPAVAASRLSADELPEYKKMMDDIAAEKARLARLQEEKMLTYTSPLYTGHIGTIMGAFRPTEEIVYCRERFIAWDGCPLYLDWLYVEGEEPEAFLTPMVAERLRQRKAKVKSDSKSARAEEGRVEATAGSDPRGHEAAAEERGADEVGHEPVDSGRRTAPHRRSQINTTEPLHGDDERQQLHLSSPGGDDEGEEEEDGAEGGGPSGGGAVSATTPPPSTRRHSLWSASERGGGRWGFLDGWLFPSTASSPSSPASSSEYSQPATAAAGRNRPQCQQRERVPFNGGRTARGVVFILPGLSSHSQSNYVQSLVRCLHRSRYHCCVLTTRGMGPDMELAADATFLFNGAYTRDARDVLHNVLSRENVMRRFFPELFDAAGKLRVPPSSSSSSSSSSTELPPVMGLPVFGVGLSIGGAILSKYLGEEGLSGRDPCLDAAVTVCPPNDFAKMVEHMNRGTYQKSVYQRDMCADVRNYILRHRQLQQMPNVDNDWLFSPINGELKDFRDAVRLHDDAGRRSRQGATGNSSSSDDVARALAAEEARRRAEAIRARKLNVDGLTRVIHFDEHIIAKSVGYRSMHHYHFDTSAVKWLPFTPIPLLAFSTFDDPVIGRTVLGHRWREIINGNNYLAEHARARRVFNAANYSTTSNNNNTMNSMNYYSTDMCELAAAAEGMANSNSNSNNVHGGAAAASPKNKKLRKKSLYTASVLSGEEAREILQNTIQNNKNVVYCESHCGGHLGFLGGPFDELRGRHNFMERFVVQRLDAASEFYFTKVLRSSGAEAAGIVGHNSVTDAANAPVIPRIFAEERRLDGIMRPPYVVDAARRREAELASRSGERRPQPLTRSTASPASPPAADAAAASAAQADTEELPAPLPPHLSPTAAGGAAATTGPYGNGNSGAAHGGAGRCLAAPKIIAKVPVPPPRDRRSNKCYVTHKTLHSHRGRTGNDFHNFYSTFFVSSGDDDDDAREGEGEGDCTRPRGGPCGGGVVGAAPERVNTEWPLRRWEEAGKRTGPKGARGAGGSLADSNNSRGDDDDDDDDDDTVAIHVLDDLLSSPSEGGAAGASPPPPLYEHPSMDGIMARNRTCGNAVLQMTADVLDLQTFQFEINSHKSKGSSSGSSSSPDQQQEQQQQQHQRNSCGRLYNFHGYLLNWMEPTGPFRPVNVHCDYNIDPRLYMREDL